MPKKWPLCQSARLPLLRPIAACSHKRPCGCKMKLHLTSSQYPTSVFMPALRTHLSHYFVGNKFMPFSVPVNIARDKIPVDDNFRGSLIDKRREKVDKTVNDFSPDEDPPIVFLLNLDMPGLFSSSFALPADTYISAIAPAI